MDASTATTVAIVAGLVVLTVVVVALPLAPILIPTAILLAKWRTDHRTVRPRSVGLPQVLELASPTSKPGWYLDPRGHAERWWTGRDWAAHTRPVPPPGTAPLSQARPETAWQRASMGTVAYWVFVGWWLVPFVWGMKVMVIALSTVVRIIRIF